MNSRLRILIFIALLSLAGCRDVAAPSQLATCQMQIGSKTFTLEIADTDLTRNHGLMRRDSLPADRGMIFVFDNEEKRSFWMKDTRIPLDILYLDSSGRIVSIHQMQPYDRTSVPSKAPARYAVELNQGAAAQAGVKPDDVLTVPAEVRPK